MIFSAATAGVAQSATHIATATAEPYDKPGARLPSPLRPLREGVGGGGPRVRPAQRSPANCFGTDILILLSRRFSASATACQYPLRALRAIPAQAAPVPA